MLHTVGDDDSSAIFRVQCAFSIVESYAMLNKKPRKKNQEKKIGDGDDIGGTIFRFLKYSLAFLGLRTPSPESS